MYVYCIMYVYCFFFMCSVFSGSHCQTNGHFFNKLMNSSPQLVASTTTTNLDLTTIDSTNDESIVRISVL